MGWNPEDHYTEIQMRLPGSGNRIFAVRKYHRTDHWYPFWLDEAGTIKPLGEPDFSDKDLDKAINNFVEYRREPTHLTDGSSIVKFYGNWQVMTND